jgi:hypothetical protein
LTRNRAPSSNQITAGSTGGSDNGFAPQGEKPHLALPILNLLLANEFTTIQPTWIEFAQVLVFKSFDVGYIVRDEISPSIALFAL